MSGPRALCFLALLALLGMLPGPLAAAVRLIPSPEGVYHSAHPDFGLRDDLVTQERIRAFTDLAGREIVWSYVSFHWDGGIRFPLDACRTLHAEGIVPLIGMMPWSTLRQGKPEPTYTLAGILDGRFDDEIRGCAEDVKSLGFPVMIEFGPEVNGSWFPWNGAWNGRDSDLYGESGHPDGPERFKDAFRHIVALFRETGAVDVTWVFHVAAESAPPLEWNRIRYYYPGDEWVDWIGVSVYGRLKDEKPARSFDDIMRRVYPELEGVSDTKPLAVLEMGVSDAPHLGDKAKWITDALESIRAGRYPRLRAISWWNKIYRPDGSRSSLEINSSRESLDAYRRGINNLITKPYWAK